jgi:hypothetical protein
MAPSKNWREEIAPDEETRFAGFAEELAAMQRRRNAKYGRGRALHRKQVLALRGTFEVLDHLPEHARHGLFAKPGKYEARIRLSNGSMDVSSDKKPDIRGYALKVLGVSGPGALGIPTDSQDFVMINRPSFGFKKPDFFMALLRALKSGPHAVYGLHVREFGLVGGTLAMGRLIKGQLRKFTGFATETFSTAVPIACGPYAMRVRLLPSGRSVLPGKDKLMDDLRAQLEKGPLVHELQLQFFVSEEITPIEDGSVDWPEDQAPWITAGRLTVAPQSFDGDEAKRLADESESGKFDPWNALVEHRPLGAIMRARKAAYFKSQQERGVA